MGYLVLARKWRPKTFEEVVGQEHVTTTLANAIKGERVAHAYLFTGPRGVGKTTTARILARALNCASGPTPQPCGKCDPCKSISAGSNLDVLEIDGASNRGIDDVRELRQQVRYAPSEGRYKVYIIDEVHMLTDAAFNALLKTLEEPPAHVVFIFATTSPQKIPLTILSRCQRFDFNLIPAQRILQRLKAITKKEKFKIDEGGLALIARKARGSLRDAESLLDQVTSAAEGALDEGSVTELLGIGGSELYFELCDHINKSDASSALKDADSALRAGLDMGEFMSGLIEHMRALFLLSVDPGLETALDVPGSELPRYREQAKVFNQNELLRLLGIASEAAGLMKRSEDPRFHAEVALARMAEVGTEVGLGDIVRRLEELEGRLAAGGGARGAEVSGAGASGAGPGEDEDAQESAAKRKAARKGKSSTARKPAKPARRSAGVGPESADVQDLGSGADSGIRAYDGPEGEEARTYNGSGVVEGAGGSASAGDTARFAVGATGVEAAKAGPAFDQSLEGGCGGAEVWDRGAEPAPQVAHGMTVSRLQGLDTSEATSASPTAEPQLVQKTTELPPTQDMLEESPAPARSEPPPSAAGASQQPQMESIPQAQLEELWREVVKRVTERKTYLGNFLTVATPVEARGGDLALAFPEAFSFHRDKVSENTNKRLIQEAMEGVFGEFLRLRCLTVSDATSGRSNAPGSAESWAPLEGASPEMVPGGHSARDTRLAGSLHEGLGAGKQQAMGAPPEGLGAGKQQAVGAPPEVGSAIDEHRPMGPQPAGGSNGEVSAGHPGIGAASPLDGVPGMDAGEPAERGRIRASEAGPQDRLPESRSGDHGRRNMAPAAEGLDERVRRVLELFGGEVLKD